MSTIFEFGRESRDEYQSDKIEIADGYEFSQYDTLRPSHSARFGEDERQNAVGHFSVRRNCAIFLGGKKEPNLAAGGVAVLSFSAGVLFLTGFEEWLRSEQGAWMHAGVALLFVFVVILFSRRILARN